MKLFALVCKLPKRGYISQIVAIENHTPRLLATTAFPRESRKVAASEGFALKRHITTERE